MLDWVVPGLRDWIDTAPAGTIVLIALWSMTLMQIGVAALMGRMEKGESYSARHKAVIVCGFVSLLIAVVAGMVV